MLNRSGGSGHLFLGRDLRRKVYPLPANILLDINTCKYLSLLSVLKDWLLTFLGAVLNLRCFILVAMNKGWLFSRCRVWASHWSGFCCRAQAVGPAGSVLGLPCSGAQAQCSGSRALEHGLSSCGSRALEHGLSSYSSRALEHGLSVAAPGLWSTGSVLRLPGSGAQAQ